MLCHVKNKAFLLLLLFLQILPASATAQQLKIDINPKPAKQDQRVYISVEFDFWDRAPTDIRVFVDGTPIATETISISDRSPGRYTYHLRGIAPKEFDWRDIKIRIDGQDYPAGLDDPYMICDAPFRVGSSAMSIPISATFHDADNDDVQLQYIEVFNDATGTLVTSYPIWEWISVPYHYYVFNDLTAGNFNCSAGDTAWIKVVLHCDDHDIPFIPEYYTFTQHLKVRVGRDLPSLLGWYCGDVHTHSPYTNNLYEYGGPLEMYTACSEANGLSFVTISDHSCDFDAAGNLWSQMADACALNSTDAVHLFPAEEVTCDDNEVDNTIDNRIHFLSYSNYFIPGPEVPLTFTMHTSNRLTFLSEALALMEAGGGFGYAAHPFQDYDPFASLLGLAMMPWSVENYQIARSSFAFSGLELWNERNRYKKNVDYWYELNPFPWEDNPTWSEECAWIEDGMEQWDAFLSDGLTINLVNPGILPQKHCISAGSDCHGGFNYRTYNTDPITFDVYATDNAFGMLRTCVYVPGYPAGQTPPLEEMMLSYRLGRSFLTDGPLLIIGLDANGDGDLDDPDDLNFGGDAVLLTSQSDSARIIVRWESTEDWGMVESIHIYRGTPTTGSTPTEIWTHGPNSYSGQENINLAELLTTPTDGWLYLRAEAYGVPVPDDARRAITNPLWIRVDETPTASINLAPESAFILIPETGGSFDYTISVQNHQSSPVSCDVWMDAILPNGSTYELLNVPVSLPATQTFLRQRQQAIPSGAPSGAYAYRAHIGVYPQSWASDAFMFYKLGMTDSVQPVRGEEIFALNTEGLGIDPVTEPQQIDVTVFPTPFNASTNISLELPGATNVRLAIYNLLGQEIFLLQDGWLDGGHHTYQWNAMELSSGVYLYRLEAYNTEISGKMLLIK
jgi:hypothetical protein